MLQKVNNPEYIARMYKPIIYQEWASIFDCITPIVTKDEIKQKIYIMEEAVNKPTLYYKVREDAGFYYIFYMVYHPLDWSNNPIFGKADSHLHDTECVGVRVDKETKSVDLATRNHFAFKFKKNAVLEVVVNKGSHSITPVNGARPKGNFLTYSVFILKNFDDMTDEEYQKMKEELNAVGTEAPDQQADTDLKLSSYSYGERHKPGDLFLRPDVLFRIAEKRNKLI